MQAAESIRAIRAAKPGDKVLYFSSDPETGLLMEARQKSKLGGGRTASARDADDIARVAYGLHLRGIGILTQQRYGQPGDWRFNYYITLTRVVTPTDINRAREIAPSLFADAA